MTDYSLSGAFGAGPVSSASDPGNQYTLGLSWNTTAGAGLWLKGYEFWRADGAVTGPITAETWDQAGVALSGSVATFSLSGTQVYQQALLPSPVPIVVGQAYRSGCHFPNGAYAFTSNYWSSGPGSGGITSGRLTAPRQASAPDGEQGVLIGGTSRAFPANGSGTAANFWITPILTDVDPGGVRSGSVDLPLAVAGSIAGVKAAVGSTSAAVVVAGSLTGSKRTGGAIGAPLAVSAGVGGVHVNQAAVSSTVGVRMMVAGTNPSATPHSAVLCSAWAAEEDVPEAVHAEMGLTSDQWSRAFMIASEILWALSGRRWYGAGCLEEAYLRSVPPRTGTGSWPYHESWGECGCWFRADWINGYPVAAFVGPWAHVEGVYAVKLPRDVVTEVTSVTIDGVPFTSYNLTRSGWLERLDGKRWDVCSGSTVVTYRYGEPPPLGGVQAAVTLAIEIARDMYNVGKCRLPKRVSTVTRQGVTVDIVDSLDILERGGTGLTSVDLWLRAVNPEARPQRAGVISPDPQHPANWTGDAVLQKVEDQKVDLYQWRRDHFARAAEADLDLAPDELEARHNRYDEYLQDYGSPEEREESAEFVAFPVLLRRSVFVDLDEDGIEEWKALFEQHSTDDERDPLWVEDVFPGLDELRARANVAAASEQAQQVETFEQTPEVELPPAPKANAIKEDWVEYALAVERARGGELTFEEADAMTVAALKDAYKPKAD